MKQTGIKIFLPGGQWMAALLPDDVVNSLITSWMGKRLGEFHSVTCQQSGSVMAFRVSDVLAMHTFDSQQAQQPAPPSYKPLQRGSGPLFGN